MQRGRKIDRLCPLRELHRAPFPDHHGAWKPVLFTDRRGRAMADELDKKARFLKGLVIGLGILLIVGFIALVAAVGYRVTASGGDTPGGAPAVAGRVPVARTFGDVSLSLPPDTVIVTLVADGGRLFVLVESPAGAATRRIIVLDAATGAVLGTVSGSAGAPPGDLQ